MRFPLSDKAARAVRNTSPNQTWAFVMSSRKATAHVVDAHISFDTAKREARANDSCVRVGHVDSTGMAVTL